MRISILLAVFTASTAWAGSLTEPGLISLDRTPPEIYLRRAGEAYVRKRLDIAGENLSLARKSAVAKMGMGQALLFLGYESWAEGNRQWEMDPSDPYGAARNMYLHGIAMFELYSKQHPGDTEGDFASGEIAFMIRDLKLAEKYYRRVLQANFHESGVRVRLARIARDRDDKNDAHVFLNDEIKLHPDSDEAYAERGNLFMSEWNTRDAELDYRKALKLNPMNIDAHFGLGVALHLGGRYEQAIARMKIVKRLDRNFKEADWQMGRIYEKTNQIQKSIAAFRNYKRIAALLRETESVRRAEEQIRKLASIQ